MDNVARKLRPAADNLTRSWTSDPDSHLLRSPGACRPAGEGRVVLGTRDDAAVLRLDSFDSSWPPKRRGRYAFSRGHPPPRGGHTGAWPVNLSDLAAMAAEPCVFAGLSLPEPRAWLASSLGMFALADRFGVELVGW